MKYKIFFVFLILIFLLLFVFKFLLQDDCFCIVNINKNTVSYNGWLYTNKSNLMNEKNNKIQLKGVSSHGIQWFPEVLTHQNLSSLKKDWNINVFRIAMYTDPNSSGYISNPENLKNKVYELIDIAISLDLYVIVDWHILHDNNPQIYKSQSKDFFNDISKKYSNYPNIIYEICNEPNGNDVSWENDIKPYAEEIIPIIRNNSPKALVIVGTPDWSKKIKKAADNPLDFDNVLYSLHFYAGSHGSELRDDIDYCLEKDLPIFVSECGITNAYGDGTIYEEKFKTWISYLDSKNISWVYWSFSDKDESSAIIDSNYMDIINNDDSSLYNSSSNNISETTDSNIGNNTSSDIDFNNYLSESGKIIKSIFIKN